MYDIYLGSYERMIGRNAYIKVNNEFIPCRVTGYLFKSRKYTVNAEGRTKKVDRIYMTQ